MGLTGIPESKGVQAPYGARVQAAFGLAPWAAQVPPTERAGSEGSYKCCLRQRLRWAPCRQQAPFGGWRHHLPPAKAVGLWMLSSGVNLSL